MACGKRSRRIYSGLFFSFFISAGISTYAQLLDTRITINLGHSSLDKCVLQLQQATSFSFAYETSGLEFFTAKPRSFKNEKLDNIIILTGKYDYIFEEKHNVIVIGPGQGMARKTSSTYQFNGVIEDKNGDETGRALLFDPDKQDQGHFHRP